MSLKISLGWTTVGKYVTRGRFKPVKLQAKLVVIDMKRPGHLRLILLEKHRNADNTTRITVGSPLAGSVFADTDVPKTIR
jgi:hypothetical protein